MSSVTGTTTLPQLKQLYLANAGYAEDNSVAAARAFVSACRGLIVMLPAKSAHGKGGSVEFDPAMVQKQLEEARAWIAANSAPGVIHPSFGNFRDYPPGSAFPYPGYC
ncbi:MAG: hypothetical protein KGL39_26230 [Patescibacteria group bacterium]|nr:hypothetical protein [Patescibacteria group bacterium]